MKLNIIIFLILVLFFYTNCQVKDKTDPNISWVLPENESTHSDTITILVNASDNIGIEKVEIYYSSISDSPLVADSVFIGNMILNSEGQYSYEWYTDVENIPNGVYQIYCIAFDLSDNVIGVINKVIVRDTKESALSAPSGISYAVPVQYVRELIDRSISDD